MPTPPTPSPPPVPPSPSTPVYSAIKAVLNFYNSLSPSIFPNGTRPTIYLAEAPVTQTGTGPPGTQLRPPFVVLKDLGERPKIDSAGVEQWSQLNAITVFEGRFILEYYYYDLGEADAANFATMWNDADPSQHMGLAFCELAVSPPYYSLPFNCIPGECIRSYAGIGINNQRVHRTSQEYTRRVYQNPQTLYT